MKRFLLLVLGSTLLFASCSNQKQEEVIQQPEEETETEVSIIPNQSLSGDQYKMVLPYKPSAARGAIKNQITNRLDINEMEEGLRRHSTEHFSPDKYVYEEGQYLTEDYIFSLVESLNPDVDELKPSDAKDKKKKKKKEKEFRENPRVFSHVLEQNYLKKNDDDSVDLVGVSIGIALKSQYNFQVEENGDDYFEDIPKKEVMEEGQRIAEEVLEEVRRIDELKNVPIMIGLFQEEEQSSPVPGDFIAKTLVKKDENKIGDWENLKEDNVLFPSDEAEEKHNDDFQKVTTFGEKVATYFPNYVGVAGTGFYVDENLQKLSLELPIEFFGQAEVIGFTQYVYGQVKEIFPNDYDIEVTISSSDGEESLIFRKAGEEDPTVHIY